MDSTIEYLSDSTCRLAHEDLSPETVHQVKRTLIDTLGCGIGAFDGEPVVIAQRVASQVRGTCRRVFSAPSSRRRWIWRPSRTRCCPLSRLQ